MNKGMFYLLPFLVLTPVAASNALPQVEVANLLNVLEHARAVEKPNPRVVVSKPISGRNLNRRGLVKVLKPRAGRNVRNKLLIKRK